ncbi:MAG: ribonuclease HI family protein [Caldisericia bacterium]|nr:ribonuclease HI family protein [Caldisericia bacterium]
MINIFTDGASRSNPGLASCGYVIFNEETLVEEYSEFLGIKTNNFAEYFAVCKALERCILLHLTDVTVYCDSLLVVNQCNHKWKVRSGDLYPLYNTVMKLSRELHTVTFIHIPREKNSHADRLCNEALDKQALTKLIKTTGG